VEVTHQERWRDTRELTGGERATKLADRHLVTRSSANSGSKEVFRGKEKGKEEGTGIETVRTTRQDANRNRIGMGGKLTSSNAVSTTTECDG
jgi:hypothetical protein